MIARLGWLVLFVTLVGCQGRAGVAVLGELECRWDDAPAFACPPLDDEPAGRRGPTSTLEVAFRVPPLEVDDPSITTSEGDHLVSAIVAGRRVDADPRIPYLIPLRATDAGERMTLSFRSRGRMDPGPIRAGSARALLARALQDDAPLAGAACALILGGAILLVMALASTGAPGERRMLASLGAFAALDGVVQAAQAAYVWPVFTGCDRRLPHGVASYLFGLALAQFFEALYGDTPRRWIRRLSGATIAVLAGALTLDVAGVVSIGQLRVVLYTLWLAMIVAVASRVAAHRRAGDRGGPVLLAGLVGFVAISLPDLAWGFGHQVVPFNTSPIGVVFFVGALVVAALRASDTRRRALVTSEGELARRVGELEARKAEVEGLNAELRLQIEKRSRELVGGFAGHGRDASEVPELVPDDRVAERYRVVRAIGAGAMGAVYEVVRSPDERAFAMKVMTGSVTPSRAARFAREAEIAARVAHPNLVAIVDVGVADAGFLYLVMDLVRGRTLEQARETFGDVAWALGILEEIALGLAALHERGIVHRDLKPANVLLERRGAGEVARIADFGVARQEEAFAKTVAPESGAPAALTATGALVGTPLYMAPESARGEAGARADVFALGIVACEMLLGSYPFPMPPALAALAGRVVAPSIDAGPLPAPLQHLVLAMLSTDPRARPDAAAVAAAFASSRPRAAP